MNFHRAPGVQRGATLIEIMISMLLGLMLTGALLAMLSGSRTSFRQDEAFARMQDESRFAIREMTGDISMAGFIGDIFVPESIALDASLAGALATDCDRADGEPFAFSLTDSATGVDTSIIALDNITPADAVAQFSCLTAGELVPGTDIIAVKHLSGAITDIADLNAGDVAMRYNGTVGALYVHPISGAVPAPFEDRLLTPAIYFIRNYSNTPNDGIPALCRKVLGGGPTPTMTTECVAEGIENLQIEYGIDVSRNGSVDRHMTAPTQAELEAVVSVQVFLLARTADADRSYVNDKTFLVSNAAPYAPADSFRRRVFSTTVSVPNIRGRALLGI